MKLRKSRLRPSVDIDLRFYELVRLDITTVIQRQLIASIMKLNLPVVRLHRRCRSRPVGIDRCTSKISEFGTGENYLVCEHANRV